MNKDINDIFFDMAMGNAKSLNEYLRSGGDPNVTHHGIPILFQVCGCFGTEADQMFHALLDAGAQLDRRSEPDQSTILHYAAKRACLRTFKTIAVPACGDFVNALDREGVTALTTACHWSRSSGANGVKLLLELGADPNAGEPDDGITALHFAAIESELDIAIELVNAGARIECRCADGETPIDTAKRHGTAEMVKFLEESMTTDPSP